jgi:predicted small metal-binding protein
MTAAPASKGGGIPVQEDTRLARQVKCECGYIARAASDDEVLAKIRAYLRADHPQLVDKVSDDDIRSWMEVVA